MVSKRILPSITAILLFGSPLFPQISRGTVKEGLILNSRILEKEVRYTIYLPFDYQSSSRFYPVVYLLHGYSDNDMGWMQFGEAHMIADEAIATRQIPPMILAMPDAGVSWYINNFDGSVRYEDFFFEEFIPHIEASYRVRAEKRYRGIAGLSMGGFGTLIYALKHSDRFAACAAFSAGVLTDDDLINMDDTRWDRMNARLYGPGLEGVDRLTEHLKANHPLHIIRNAEPETLKKVRIYLDCGDDDFLYRGNSMLHILLRDRDIPHEYRVRDGGHRWSYWRSGLIDALRFIGADFHQP